MHLVDKLIFSIDLYRIFNNQLFYILNDLVPLNAVTLENCSKGLRVQRGRDWFHDSQDYRLGSQWYGTIRRCMSNGWADVRFPAVNNSYPIGASGIYALDKKDNF